MGNRIAKAGNSYGNQSATPRITTSHSHNASRDKLDKLDKIQINNNGNQTVPVVTFNVTGPNGLGSYPILRKTNSISNTNNSYNEFAIETSQSGINSNLHMNLNINEDSEMDDEISELIQIDQSTSPPQSPKPGQDLSQLKTGSSNYLLITNNNNNNNNNKKNNKKNNNKNNKKDITVISGNSSAGSESPVNQTDQSD